MSTIESQRVWTVAEAKARLSEILRLAEEEGPQRIGARRAFVIVPQKVWEKQTPPRTKKAGEQGPPEKSLGRFLLEDTPRGTNLPIPDRREKGRPIPFIDYLIDDPIKDFLNDEPIKVFLKDEPAE